MPPTYKQRIQRKCFAACAREWADLPEACPVPPFCIGPTTKESVVDSHAESGRMSSAYDYFMRCCLQLCNDQGDLTGDVDDCYPCPSEFDELIPDPGNQETFEDDEEFSLCVTGGVPPYTWTLLDDDCVTMGESITACNTFQAGPDACCGVEALIEDDCGNSTKVGARGVGGQWHLTGLKTCEITGPAFQQWDVKYGKWKIEEMYLHRYVVAGDFVCPGGCPGYHEARRVQHCTDVFCENYSNCDPVVGCLIASACVDDIRKADICTDIVKTTEDSGSAPQCAEGYYHECNWYAHKWCLTQRDVYEWRCP